MKERVRFAVGAASMVLAACCLRAVYGVAALRSRGGDPGGRLGGDAAAGFEGTTVGGWYRPAGGWYAAPGNAGGGAGQFTGQ